MLKGIPSILSPELLKTLSEMGHSDVLILADGNFPSESKGKNAKVIRLDGHGVPELLDAILSVFPLDTYVEKPIKLIKVDEGFHVETPIWDTFYETISKYDNRGKNAVETMERFDFYSHSQKAYAIIATSEKALYSCISLQKGVL